MADTFFRYSRGAQRNFVLTVLFGCGLAGQTNSDHMAEPLNLKKALRTYLTVIGNGSFNGCRGDTFDFGAPATIPFSWRHCMSILKKTRGVSLTRTPITKGNRLGNYQINSHDRQLCPSKQYKYGIWVSLFSKYNGSLDPSRLPWTNILDLKSPPTRPLNIKIY